MEKFIIICDREELELAGEHFESETDTEVVLSAYRLWGHSCLSRFNGMFAFTIFDSVLKKVFVARDRFGIKPLYILAQEGALHFASEIKQFHKLKAGPQFKLAPTIF